MRRDEIEARREQKKHLLSEFRSLTTRYRDGQAWSPEDKERGDYLDREIRAINDDLQAQHQRERGDPPGLRQHPQRVLDRRLRAFLRPRAALRRVRSAGFARGKPAEILWNEFRSLTWSGSVDNLDQPRRPAGFLGYDSLCAYQALPSVGVDSGVTSMSLLTQTARTLATPANVVRAIDAVTAKPETAETLTVATVALKQLASVVSDIPNVFLENNQAGSIIENDLKLAITDALDDLVRAAIAPSGFQAPGTDPLLVSIRKAMSTIMSSGYSPNTLILRPADAETLDTLQTSGTEKFYVFAAGNFAPSELFGMRRFISKTVTWTVVLDAQAFGKLYSSPVSLQTFEQDAGQTNKSRVRIEMNAQVGVERQSAAVRIAAG